MDFFLYNPKTKKNTGEKIVDSLIEKWVENNNTECKKINSIDLDLEAFLKGLDETDRIVISGGDGTLHFFANRTRGLTIKNDIYFLPSGTGNDFSNDINDFGNAPINKYLNDLPTCKFNDEDVVFINGCGLGLDGYVCYLVNNAKKKGKSTFYKSTLKGFLKYKKSDLKVYVDDKLYEFKGVYLASIMNGKYEGGGMMMAPNADRLDDLIEICVIYHMSKLRLMLSFKSIYKGKHIKHKKAVTILQGKNIKIESIKGLYMQVDGEDYKDITYLEAKK